MPYGQAPLGLEGSGAFRRLGSKGSEGSKGGGGGAYELIEGASLYKTFTTGLSPVGKPYNRPAGERNAFSPFGGWRHHLSPTSWGHYKAPLCCELLMKGLLFRALLSHRSAGGRWCRKAPKGGKSHRRWLITVVLIMSHDTEK